jgi:hypothetical protein
VRAWHYAHHNGKECRHAVAAAVSKFLAQWLGDGNGLDLPGVAYEFGNSRRARPAKSNMTFHTATAIEDPETGAWHVLAEAGEIDRSSALRIIVRTNPRHKMPTGQDCRADQISTMVIDLGAVLAIALDIAPDLCADEQWMTDQVVSEAPRRWIWTAAADRLRQAEVDQRIQPHLDAVAAFRSDPLDRVAGDNAYNLIEVLSFGEMAAVSSPEKLPVIDGEFIFKHEPMHWRSEIFLDLILKPIARAYPKNPASADIYIGWRKSGMSCRRLQLAPPSLLAKLDGDEMSEIARAMNGFRQPVRIIDAYLDELVETGVLRARPPKRRDAWMTDRYDQQLWYVKGASFSISPAFIEVVHQALKNFPEDRADILKGKLMPEPPK